MRMLRITLIAHCMWGQDSTTGDIDPAAFLTTIRKSVASWFVWVYFTPEV